MSQNAGRPLVRVYVDETGDRGSSGKSSRFFAFAALVVPEEQDANVRAAIAQLRADFGVPAGKALHWKDHVKVFPRRQHAAGVLATVEDVRVIYVVVEKSVITTNLQSDQVAFYNYAAGLVLERALLSAKYDFGQPRDAIVRFSHVSGFDHKLTSTYFDIKRASAPSWLPYHLLRKPPTFDGQASWDGLQAADQYAGMLHAAINVDQFGGHEPQHMLRIRHQLRRHPAGQADGYGWKAWLDPGTAGSWPWWPVGGL